MKWLEASNSAAAHQEHIRGAGIRGPLRNHIPVDCTQRGVFMQIDHPFSARLTANPSGMIVPPANHDSSPAIGDIAKLQVEYLSWSQAPIEH
jgi:hypothetical protein